MEIIGRISKGSKMDQIYIQKNRSGFGIGNYVAIRPIEEKKQTEKLYFYGIKHLEPVKLNIVNEIIGIISNNIENYDNVIITGSFLDRGFQFNDIDIIVLSEKNINTNKIENEAEKKIGIKSHILNLSNKSLASGIETDPLYRVMLSRCIARKRFVHKNGYKINYKLLDLHLLKSKTLIDNFDALTGKEKYDMTRNMMSICLYLEKKKVTKESVDNEIKRNFGLKDINEIKQNMVYKEDFLRKYRLIYGKTFSGILKGIKNGAEQK